MGLQPHMISQNRAQVPKLLTPLGECLISPLSDRIARAFREQ